MDELCELVIDGTHDSPKLQRHGVPFIKGKHISSGSIDFSTCDFITPEDHEEACRRVKPQRGDILFSNIGSVGDTAVVSEDREFSIKNVALFRPDRRKVEEGYLYYLVLSPEFRSNVMNMRSGSAQPFLSLANLRSFEVNYHEDTRVQRRIASILSAYDELIENNQRRIQILETMARALYREWFIEFRFPGHERFPRVASPLGDTPQGWEIVAFTEIADVLSGGTPKTAVAEYWNGEIPFFTPRDAPACFYVQDTNKHITRLGLSKCASELYAPDTVLITARGTVGKVALPSVSMAMNQSCYALRGKAGIPQRFLFLMTLQQVDYLQTNTGGATFDTIVVDTFRQMKVVKPAHEVIASFVRQIDAIFEHVDTIQRQIQNLRRTRDLLLPRLLSGQVALTDTAA